MAKYIKLRDAISDKLDSPTFRLVKCRTCSKILARYEFDPIKGKEVGNRDCQGGHYLGRGSGGSSGVYFDERNVWTQCAQCNRFRQGAPEEMELHIRKVCGDDVIEELKLKHKVESYSQEEIIALGIYYKEMYQSLLKEYNIKR
jgi:hypothetical protein